MKKILFAALLTIGAPMLCHAQVNPIIYGSGAPSNPCFNGGQYYLDTTGHVWYSCLSNGSNWSNVGSTLPSNTGGAPSGPAGGALSGTYPNPTAGQPVAPNQNVIYLSPNCGTQTNCIAAYANTQRAQDCSFTASTTIVCIGSHFVAGDAGKRISAYNTCNTNQPSYVSEFGTTATSISAVNSGTSITVSNATAGTVTNTGCIYWGTPDTAGLAALLTAISSYTTSCPAVTFPYGILWITNAALPIKFPQPAGCLNSESISGASVFGWGLNVMGYGAGHSILFLDNTVLLTGGQGAFQLPAGFNAGDFSLTGGGNPSSGSGISGSSVISLGTYGNAFAGQSYGYLHDFQCTNLGQNVSGVLPNGAGGGLPGIDDTGLYNKFLAVQNDGCGHVGMYIGLSNYVSANDLIVEDTPAATLISYATTFDCVHCQFFGGPLTLAFPLFEILAPGSYYLQSGTIQKNGAATAADGIECGGGASVYIMPDFLVYQSGAPSTTANGINDVGGICNLFLYGTSISGGSAGKALKATNTSSVVYLSGTPTTLTNGVSWAGLVHHAESGTCTFSATTTCSVTFGITFGSTVPAFTITPLNPGAITVTVTALSATGATLTASGSTSIAVGWQASL